MKRMHVHVAIEHLDDSIRFYSALFNAKPIVAKVDYAKSDKYWTMAPLGVTWETYDTRDTIPTFRDSRTNPVDNTASACCAPAATTISFRSRS